MTVETKITKKEYNGDDTTGPWAIPFPLPANTDVGAVLTDSLGTETMLTYGTDFTVTKYTAPSVGGTATTANAVPVGSKILFYLKVDITQKVDFINVGFTDVELAEAMGDKLTLICQQLARDVDRAVKVDITSGDNPEDLIDQLHTDVLAAEQASAQAQQALNQLYTRWNPLFQTIDGQLDYPLEYAVDEDGWNALVILGGLVQNPGTDYKIVNNGYTLRFLSQPPVGQSCRVVTSLSFANPDLDLQIQNILAGLSALATETNTGLSQFATIQETLDGIRSDRAVSPANLATRIAVETEEIKSERRIQATGTVLMYVNPATGSDSNDGISSVTAMASIQAAYNKLLTEYDLRAVEAQILLENGTYNTGLSAYATPNTASGSLAIIGNVADPTYVMLSNNANIYVAFGARVWVSGLSFDTSTQNNLMADHGGFLGVAGNMKFGQTNGNHMLADNGGEILISATVYAISGGAYSHLQAGVNAVIRNTAAFVVTVTTNVSISYFANALMGGVMSITSATWSLSGTVTGARGYFSTNAVCNTGGGGANYFPGTTAIVYAGTGEQYV